MIGKVPKREGKTIEKRLAEVELRVCHLENECIKLKRGANGK